MDEQGKPPIEIKRDLGIQPIAEILTERGLKSHDLVEASTEHITHKMVIRACKGRRLTTKVQRKIVNALNRASSESFTLADLFNYR